MPVIVTTIVAIGLQAAAYLARRGGKAAAGKDAPSSAGPEDVDARAKDGAAPLPIEEGRRAA